MVYRQPQLSKISRLKFTLREFGSFIQCIEYDGKGTKWDQCLKNDTRVRTNISYVVKSPSVFQIIVFILLFGLAVAEKAPYQPRGWRPNGQSFNPGQDSYGPPAPANSYGPQTGASEVTTTTTTTTEIPTTTTPRSREPTTPFEDDLETGPALAVANSFAFNRPVYVYNSFPYYSAAYTLGK